MSTFFCLSAKEYGNMHLGRANGMNQPMISPELIQTIKTAGEIKIVAILRQKIKK